MTRRRWPRRRVAGRAHQRRQRPERVVDVEPPGQRHAARTLTPPDRRVERAPGRPGDDVLGPPVRRPVAGPGVRRRRQLGRSASRRPYGSSRFTTAALACSGVKSRALARSSPRFVVEVEVVRPEVREHRDVEHHAPDPAEGERMARHLHRDCVHATLDHDREQCVQIGRLRRRALARQDGVADPGLDRADQAGRRRAARRPASRR